MYRLKHYRRIKGGFTNFTKNASFGQDGLFAEKMISLFYYEQGLRVFPSSNVYVTYIETNQDWEPIQWSKFSEDFS